jgi:hypothetical protein
MENKVNISEESKKYFFKFVVPLIQSQFPHYLERITAGYFGHGSQCLGFDDEISRDHDWGIRFCILLNDKDYADMHDDLTQLLAKLPPEYNGFKLQNS